jgi:type III pantothenate kinase
MFIEKSSYFITIIIFIRLQHVHLQKYFIYISLKIRNLELLVVDVGNTRTKWAVYQNGLQVYFKSSIDEEIIQITSQILQQFPNLNKGICASVRKKSDLQWFSKIPFVRFIDRNDKFPFINLYATPETLGLDRMVLAAGSVLKFPKQNRLVIDAGTCITFDFISSDDTYFGGGISPGLDMRYKAMHEFTAKLPRLTAEYPKSLIGNSTEQSMHVGVTKGILAEMDSFIDDLNQQYGNIKIILTGGDAVFLAKQLKNRIFALPNFLLESLLSIYEYQNQNP